MICARRSHSFSRRTQSQDLVARGTNIHLVSQIRVVYALIARVAHSPVTGLCVRVNISRDGSFDAGSALFL